MTKVRLRLGGAKSKEKDDVSSTDSDDSNLIPPKAPRKSKDVPAKVAKETIGDEKSIFSNFSEGKDKEEHIPMVILPKYSCTAKLQNDIINLYEMTLLVSTPVAEALYNKEELTTPAAWAQMSDRLVHTVGKLLQKQSMTVPVCSTKKMKLLVFLCKHKEQTSRAFDLYLINKEDLFALQDQKEEEDKYHEKKTNPDPAALPLDGATAAKSLALAKMILKNFRGAKGISLAQVI